MKIAANFNFICLKVLLHFENEPKRLRFEIISIIEVAYNAILCDINYCETNAACLAVRDKSR